jgi:hypothetical protein
LKPRALATLVEDRDCRVRVEFWRGYVFFHCKFHRWSVRAMRVVDAAYPKMMSLMADLGFEFLHLFIPDGKQGLYRFCERFGFREVERKSGWVLMRQEVRNA